MTFFLASSDSNAPLPKVSACSLLFGLAEVTYCFYCLVELAIDSLRGLCSVLARVPMAPPPPVPNGVLLIVMLGEIFIEMFFLFRD